MLLAGNWSRVDYSPRLVGASWSPIAGVLNENNLTVFAQIFRIPEASVTDAWVIERVNFVSVTEGLNQTAKIGVALTDQAPIGQFVQNIPATLSAADLAPSGNLSLELLTIPSPTAPNGFELVGPEGWKPDRPRLLGKERVSNRVDGTYLWVLYYFPSVDPAIQTIVTLTSISAILPRKDFGQDTQLNAYI